VKHILVMILSSLLGFSALASSEFISCEDGSENDNTDTTFELNVTPNRTINFFTQEGTVHFRPSDLIDHGNLIIIKGVRKLYFVEGHHVEHLVNAVIWIADDRSNAKLTYSFDDLPLNFFPSLSCEIY